MCKISCYICGSDSPKQMNDFPSLGERPVWRTRILSLKTKSMLYFCNDICSLFYKRFVDGIMRSEEQRFEIAKNSVVKTGLTFREKCRISVLKKEYNLDSKEFFPEKKVLVESNTDRDVKICYTAKARRGTERVGGRDNLSLREERILTAEYKERINWLGFVGK